jgi:hypothetical protein
MEQNKLADLNDYLFSQMKRLSDKDLNNETIKLEIERTKALTSVSKEILDNAKINLEASKFTASHLSGLIRLPNQFETPPVEVNKIDPQFKIEKKISTNFKPSKNADLITQKNEYAVYLGYKDMMGAIADLSAFVFNNRFQKEVE